MIRLGFAIVAVLLLVVACTDSFWPAASQEADHKQMYHSDPHYDAWFKSLKQPDTNFSCCDLKDCDRTEAEWRPDGWWAIVRGHWRQIPSSKIVKTPLSIDGEAYVCANPSTQPAEKAGIYCFVPPIPGY